MNRKYVGLLIIGLFSLLSLHFQAVSAASYGEEVSDYSNAWWPLFGGSRAMSHIKWQKDLVYDHDETSGMEEYLLYVHARNKWAYCPTKTIVKIYVQAYYKTKRYAKETFQYRGTTYRWDAAPQDLIQWNYNYHYYPAVGTSYTYSYRVGGSWEGVSISFGIGISPKAYADYGRTQSISNGWRYIGWFSSTYSDWHEFDAGLKLSIANSIAHDYADGYPREDVNYYYLDYLQQFQFKCVFQFQSDPPNWPFTTWRTHTHTLGDGVGLGDMKIYFRAGESPS